MASLQPRESLWKRDTVDQLVSKASATSVDMVWRPLKLPDHFALAKAAPLTATAPSYLIGMTFRIWLITDLRVSEALSLRCSDIRPETPVSEAHKGWEIAMPKLQRPHW